MKTVISKYAVILAALSAVMATPSAFGFGDKDLPRYFDAEGKLSADGRKLVLSGNSDCRPTDGKVHVSAAVLQDSSTAGARGFSTEQPCTLKNDTFTAEIAVREGRPSFAAGPAVACALLRTSNSNGVVDFDHWCSFVLLVVDPAL